MKATGWTLPALIVALTSCAPTEPVRVRPQEGTAEPWSGCTDALGCVVISRRALGLPAGGPPAALLVMAAGATVVVTVPTDVWSPPGPDGAPAEVEEEVARDGLEPVARRLAAAVGSGAIATDAPAARALPGLLRRRGGPLPLDDAARPHVDAAARGLRECATLDEVEPSAVAAVREHLAAALEVAPGCWEAHRLLGATARLTGDEPTAARHLQIALCLLPETSPLAAKVASELTPP